MIVLIYVNLVLSVALGGFILYLQSRNRDLKRELESARSLVDSLLRDEDSLWPVKETA